MKKLAAVAFIVLFLFTTCKKSPEGTAPLAPSGLTANIFFVNEVELKWQDNSTNELGYKIERKSGSGAFVEIAAVAADVTSYTDKNVIANNDYTYRIYGFNKTGKSLQYSNEVNITAKTLTTGDFYQGGYIVYFLQQQDPGFSPTVPHGLIAAQNDGGIGPWIARDQNKTNGKTKTGIGHGQANTNFIISQGGFEGGAAKICNDYSVTVNGVTYSDWYLPSSDELAKLWNLISKPSGSPTITSWYWSSSEYSSETAIGRSFNSSGVSTFNGMPKGNDCRVRPFRSF